MIVLRNAETYFVFTQDLLMKYDSYVEIKTHHRVQFHCQNKYFRLNSYSLIYLDYVSIYKPFSSRLYQDNLENCT